MLDGLVGMQAVADVLQAMKWTSSTSLRSCVCVWKRRAQRKSYLRVKLTEKATARNLVHHRLWRTRTGFLADCCFCSWQTLLRACFTSWWATARASTMAKVDGFWQRKLVDTTTVTLEAANAKHEQVSPPPGSPCAFSFTLLARLRSVETRVSTA